MMDAKIKILILENGSKESETILKELKNSNFDFSAEVIRSTDNIEMVMEKVQPDIIVSNFNKSPLDIEADPTFDLKQKKYPEVPFIIFSKIISHENESDFLKKGVTEVVPLDQPQTLLPVLNRIANEESLRKENKLLSARLGSLTKEFEMFSTFLSHDLRAPVRAVKGYLKIITEEYYREIDSEGQRIIRQVQNGCNKLSELMDNLLSFSRITTRELSYREIDMKELLEEVLEELKKNSNHSATINIGKLMPLNADFTLIYLMFNQLLSNALKFSARRSNPIIEISSEEKDGMIIYTVADNGVGFDMKDAGKLFVSFQRLHDPEEFEGNGIGLPIVDRITKKHHGKVWVEAETDKGAKFFVSFPIKEEEKN